METKIIGLIAGKGKFPILFARAAKLQGLKVVAVGVKGDTSILLKAYVDSLAYFHVGEIRKSFAYLKTHHVTDVILAGQISQRNLFDQRVQSDPELKEFFSALQDRKADTIFSAVVSLLDKNGLKVMDSTLLLKAFMAQQGVVTRRSPSEQESADVEFGRNIAKAMGGLDVGQTVVIKEKAIVAIEAMEGTDQCILRGGKIARQGAVVIKMSKPEQDTRFDVPVVGPATIRNMIRSKCRCLGIEAQKTLVIDLDRCVAMANKAGICIICV